MYHSYTPYFAKTVEMGLTIEREVLDWNPQGQWRRGRPKQTWRRSVHGKALGEGKSWGEGKQLARNRIRWRHFVDALCP
jgi:hypothetical protein